MTDLHALITAAIRDCPARYPDDIAAAVHTAIRPELERLDRAEAELRRYTEADSADAAAGSYAERAETAERERDIARQHAAAIAAQRDRLRQRMNTLADRWDHALAPDKPYARTLRNEISCAPFDPDGAMTVQEYTERGRHLWAFRCWGTDTCDGWLGLGHHTQTSALSERERHVVEAHTPEASADDRPTRVEAVLADVLAQFTGMRNSDNTGPVLHYQARVTPGEYEDWQEAADGSSPAADETADAHVYLSTGCLHGEHGYCSNVDGIAGLKKPAQCKFCAAPCQCPCHTISKEI